MATHIPKTPSGGRAHLLPTRELTEDEAVGQKKLLSQDKGEEVTALSSAVQDELVKKLAAILFQKANSGITNYNKVRNAAISVGSGTPYDGILQLVFSKVKQHSSTAMSLTFSPLTKRRRKRLRKGVQRRKRYYSQMPFLPSARRSRVICQMKHRLRHDNCCLKGNYSCCGISGAKRAVGCGVKANFHGGSLSFPD